MNDFTSIHFHRSWNLQWLLCAILSIRKRGFEVRQNWIQILALPDLGRPQISLTSESVSYCIKWDSYLQSGCEA